MKEPKLKTVYVCSNCGETSPRWMGRCPSCGSWNTMNEDVVAETPKAGLSGGKSAAPVRQEGVTSLTAKRLADISTTEEKSRILTGISELDRVLGGGIVLGGVVLHRLHSNHALHGYLFFFRHGQPGKRECRPAAGGGQKAGDSYVYRWPRQQGRCHCRP